jgi:hypothetical protein
VEEAVEVSIEEIGDREKHRRKRDRGEARIRDPLTTVLPGRLSHVRRLPPRHFFFGGSTGFVASNRNPLGRSGFAIAESVVSS